MSHETGFWLQHRVGAVLPDDDATVRQPLRCAIRTAQHGGLGQDLGFGGGRGQRRRLDDPGERRRSGPGVQEMMGRAAIAVTPAALGDPAGGDRPRAQRKGVQRRLV